MYSKEFPVVVEDEASLQALMKEERDARRRLRLHLLLLISTDAVATRREAADVLAVHRNSITNWLRKYEHGGLDALLEIKIGGPPSEQTSIPEAAYRCLEEALAAGHFTRYAEVQRWLQTEQNVPVSYRTVHAIVRYRMGYRLRRPKMRAKRSQS